MVRKVRMVNGQVQKDIKVEITLSIVHKYHGQKCQKGQNGQWSRVQKDIKI